MENKQIRLQDLADTLSLGMATVSQGRIASCNEHFVAMFRGAAQEFVGAATRALFAHERDFLEARQAHKGQRIGVSRHPARQFVRRDGEKFWARLSGANLDEQAASASVWLFEDVTAEHAVFLRWQEESAEHKAVFENAAIGIDLTRNRFIKRCNRRMEEIFGWGPDELIGKSARVFFRSDEEFVAFGERAYAELARSGQADEELCMARQDGSLVWVRLSGRNVLDVGGRPSGDIIWIYQDITARKRIENELAKTCAEMEQRIEERTAELADLNAQLRREVFERSQAEQVAWNSAHHDALTGLPNRTLLMDRIHQAFTQAQRYKRRFALMFLDLDGFKSVNDTLGHRVGDELLKAVALRLKSAVRHSDTVARLGGDEFIVLLSEFGEVADVLAVAQKVVDAIGQVFDVAADGQPVDITTSASVGISLYPDHGEAVDELMQCADMAMYAVKSGGRHGFRLFSSDMHNTARRRFVLDQRLRRALEERQFVVHYQAQYDTTTARVCGTEALLRWDDPKEGLISPAEFIPIAEESGLILPIGAWVLAESLRQNMAWQQAGHPAVPVSVNLSLRQFRQADLVESVLEILGETGHPAHLLKLEITESLLIQDMEGTLAKLERFAKAGIQLAVDDFGTGYSSLNHLKDLPVHQIKIDQSFVRDLAPGRQRENAIIRAIVGMAGGLNLDIMVEGVENHIQLDSLTSHGCSKFQGYLFARPQAPEMTRSIFFQDWSR